MSPGSSPEAWGHAVILAAGAVLVHYPAGWFVVGAGRNGMEYSALLIVGLLAVAWAHWPAPGARWAGPEPLR